MDDSVENKSRGYLRLAEIECDTLNSILAKEQTQVRETLECNNFSSTDANIA